MTDIHNPYARFSDTQLAEKHAAALARAHDAPKNENGSNWSDAWARWAREAEQIQAEMKRRANP